MPVMTPILNLPPEIVSHILSYVQSAQTINRLSLTCHKLNDFVEQEGWKVFVQTRFPSIPTAPTWKDAAHTMTSLSRNWDRKAFLARAVEPSRSIWTLPGGAWKFKWTKPRGQTMGFQPVIDSYEVQTGSTWASKLEVLAWSAGAELIVRSTNKSPTAFKEWEESSNRNRNLRFNHHHQKRDFITYKEPTHEEGKDDITALKLIRPHQKNNRPDASEQLVVGRATGQLQLIDLSISAIKIITDYETGGLPVRAADIGPSEDALLAACLGDTSVSIYKLHGSDAHCDTHSSVQVLDGKEDKSRTWCTRFLSRKRLAVGCGVSTDIISVYDVREDGLSARPTRTFKPGDRYDDPEKHASSLPSTSAYALENLPPSSSAADGMAGNVFLSGCYDGYVRLHDMRSAEDFEALFFDTFEDSAIFSLQCIGRERFAAGAAQHSLVKIFDLRMAGGRAYDYISVLDPDKKAAISAAAGKLGQRCMNQSLRRPNPIDITATSWNLFAKPRNGLERPSRDSSPIYSLSSPSPSSLSLYAGFEGRVMQLDFIDIMDSHPDPTFVHGIDRTSSGAIHAKNTWNPDGDVVSLAMYEGYHSGHVPLRYQRGVGRYGEDAQGYDARWERVMP